VLFLIAGENFIQIAIKTDIVIIIIIIIINRLYNAPLTVTSGAMKKNENKSIKIYSWHKKYIKVDKNS